MLQSPTDQVIVQVTTKYIKNISNILKTAEIQNMSSVSAADLVNIVGVVVSAPKALTKEFSDYSLNDVLQGDTAIFSHEVIYSFLPTAPEDDPIFKNMFHYKGDEYFTCNPRNLYAVIRDGNIRMQNGYVMVENMTKSTSLYLPQHIRKSINCGTGILTKIGNTAVGEKLVEAQSGDTVYFNANKIRLHQINGKPFGILKQSQLLCMQIPEYGELASVTG